MNEIFTLIGSKSAEQVIIYCLESPLVQVKIGQNRLKLFSPVPGSEKDGIRVSSFATF